MFEQNVSTENCLVKSMTSDKNIVVSASLLMRLFEFCHEEAKNDVSMHKVLEKMMAFTDGINPLTIDTYEAIIANVNDGQESDEESDKDDLDNAYDLGAQQAELGNELSDDGRDYSIVAGEMITNDKDNGYGASNAELEAFWNGYESEPLKKGCFTEVDVSDCVHKPMIYNIKGEPQFNHCKPTTIPLNCDEDDCCKSFENNCVDGLDEETLKQIEEIIGISKI